MSCYCQTFPSVKVPTIKVYRKDRCSIVVLQGFTVRYIYIFLQFCGVLEPQVLRLESKIWFILNSQPLCIYNVLKWTNSTKNIPLYLCWLEGKKDLISFISCRVWNDDPWLSSTDSELSFWLFLTWSSRWKDSDILYYIFNTFQNVLLASP